MQLLKVSNMLISRVLIHFWIKHPALFYGLSLLLGFYAFFFGFFQILVPLSALLSPFVAYFFYQRQFLWKPFCLSLTLFCTCWFYGYVYYQFPQLPKEGIEGTATISIQNIRLQRSFMGSKWLYYCEIQQFFPSSSSRSIASHIKCAINLPHTSKIKRPLAQHDYLVKGKLVRNDKGFYVLKVSTLNPWEVVKSSWSFAEIRYQWKKKLQVWIQNHFSNSLSATFLSGLATGEFDDQWLRGEFARFGLQHIMAISGFHFAILIGLLALLLRLFLSRKYAACLLLVLISSYAFFLGASPSIMRAWIMCALVVVGCLIEKNAFSLNSLGIALIGVVLYDPLFSQTIGFQFSFLTTAAILLLYRPLHYFLERLFIKRNLSEVIEMSLADQHGYCILAFFRQGLALMLAVNLCACPLTLYYFDQFPLLSLLYNLFFPFLVAGALGLLIFSFLTAGIPVIGSFVQSFNNVYTHFILKLTYNLPKEFDYHLRIENISELLLVSYLSFLFYIAIIMNEKGVSEECEFNSYV